MSIYGGNEVVFYQLTPAGTYRVQNSMFRHLDNASRQILMDIAELGGAAEWDELKMRSFCSPMVLRESLKRLIDFGLVVPTTSLQ